MTQNFLTTPPTQPQARLSSSPLLTPPQREPLRHLLIGSPKAVRSAIHALHHLGYAEAGIWSPLLPTANPREVMSILVRYVLLE